jgi:hypothetical protein
MPLFRISIPEQTIKIDARDEDEALMLVDVDGLIEVSDIEEIEDKEY